MHGTTVATNSVIQYRGATTALLTTRGFRDSLEMRRCHRAGQWDFFTPQPPLIVPRYLRRGIDERVLYDGTVDTPLDENQLMEEVDDLVANHQVEAIGICFLFSFKNTAHEARAAELIRSRYPDVFVSASHEISPQIREYERTCTTVINAFVGPVLSRYLSNLGKFLADNRLAHEYQVIQSNGGVTAASAAGQHGARALLSGPAGGAIGGLMLAEAVGRENLIVADMGGTSFDLTLIQEKELQLVAETEIAGYTISLPMIGIHTIGAGGGSIGHIDDSGLLKVGPRSAGSLPGPACYARGGTEPTVTDANLVLGFLSPSYFLGGAMPLDTDLARQAIKQHVADPFGLTVEEGAQAIFEIVNSNMVDAIHVVTVQKGYDPREYALVAAGGAAPIHTGVLARALEISQVIVPKASSVFCAIGACRQTPSTTTFPPSSPRPAKSMSENWPRSSRTWCARASSAWNRTPFRRRTASSNSRWTCATSASTGTSRCRPSWRTTPRTSRRRSPNSTAGTTCCTATRCSTGKPRWSIAGSWQSAARRASTSLSRPWATPTPRCA